jgi:uncharacterized membrane protein YphA (DoxX/SURF4 family)
MRYRDGMFTAGIALLRIGFGLMFLTNGISKLTGWSGIHPFPGFLINLGGPGQEGGAFGIISANVRDHPIGPYFDFIHNLVLPNWGIFGPLITLAELAVGVSLILGLFTPLGAILGVLFILHLNLSVWNRNVWAWEYAVEWVPLTAIALVRAGQFWGLDARLAKRFPRWPLT